MAFSLVQDGSITHPQGYKATGVHAGLKPTRDRDLALVVSTQPCSAAAMFTISSIKGAPVLFDQAILARNRDQIRGVLINSGIANVGLGRAGLEIAVECARVAAEELELPRDSLLLMGTGVIGVPLPIDKMKLGIHRAVSELDSGGGHRAALAIMTADRRPKELALTVKLRSGQHVVLAGMAKGSHRVHPNLATVLCLITTDAAIPAPLLARSLRSAVDSSFHCITIDGDMGPNDTILMLANGAAGAAPIKAASSWEYGAWLEGLTELTRSLARMLVEDSAGTGPLMSLEVNGARTDGEARLVAMALCRSFGVRDSWRAGTIDWGAMLAALGSSGAEVLPELLALHCGEQLVVVDGQLRPEAIAQLPPWNQQREIMLRLALQIGDGRATVWSCT